MLRIFHTAAVQVNLPLDTTGFGNDDIANTKLANVAKMRSGLLATINPQSVTSVTSRGRANLATSPGGGGADAAAALAAARGAVMRPLGFIIVSADYTDYYNRPAVASHKLSILPLSPGTIVEVPAYALAGTFANYLPGDVVYLGVDGQLTETRVQPSAGATAYAPADLTPIGVVLDNDDTTGKVVGTNKAGVVNQDLAGFHLTHKRIMVLPAPGSWPQ